MTRVLLTIAAIGMVALSLPAPVSAAAAANTSFRVAAARLRRATLDVINDVEQRKVAVSTGDPRAIDPTDKQIEKDAKLWSQEFKLLGPLEAPKKSWLDADVADVQRWVQVLNDDVSALTPDQQTAMGDNWATVQSTMADVNSQLTQLQSLAAGPDYDNLKIAQTALQIRDDAKKLLSLAGSAKASGKKNKATSSASCK